LSDVKTYATKFRVIYPVYTSPDMCILRGNILKRAMLK